MLDVIADFWKPVKKGQAEKLNPDQLQVGSSIGFGFVPQAMLSGRRLHVDKINTYQFGEETLTSFQLVQDKNAPAPGASMIVAEAEGEHYLAISRNIAQADRAKLFDGQDLDNVINKAETSQLTCRDNVPECKGWVVPLYKREIQGLKGRLYSGDFRKEPLPQVSEGKEFQYTLLVSESNEHAIEIEKYSDGRIEVYATIYRRMNDIGEITHPAADTGRPDIKLASAAPAAETVSPAPAAAPSPRFIAVAQTPEAPKPQPITLQELTPAPEPKPAPVSEEKPAAPKVNPPEPPFSRIEKPSVPPVTEPKTPMNTPQHTTNGATPPAQSPKLYVQPNTPTNFMKQEIKAVATNGATNNFEADAIECDLRVANKIIDEAIRNEMRLTDIVRRIIELPVAYPESVQIPISLTDEDFALLAIRYSLPSTDRNAIKRRIIEDLNDFSGNKKAA